MKTERPRSWGRFWSLEFVVFLPAPLSHRWRATARAKRRREAQATKTNQVNTCMATADYDRQGQAAHRQYKSSTVVEFASGKYMHNRHS